MIYIVAIIFVLVDALYILFYDKATFSFQKPNFEKLNGPFAQYTIAYKIKQSGADLYTNVTNMETTFYTLKSLKKWTVYFIKVSVKNRDHAGPWSVGHDAKTQQDGLFTITLNLFL